MTPRHEALNLASPLIHNERQNIPHDIHLSLSDHVIYGHVPSGLYTRDIEHCECASVHKIPWQTHLGKRPPAWIVYEGVSGERERVGLSSGVRLALAAPPPGPIRVCFEPGGASDGDRRLLRRTDGRTDGDPLACDRATSITPTLTPLHRTDELTGPRRACRRL